MTTLDRGRLGPVTFEDGFAGPSLDPKWKTSFWFGTPGKASSRMLSAANNKNIYVDPTYAPLPANPFAFWGDALQITARPTVPSDASGQRAWTSGLITTETSFAQQYGYFEMRAIVPQVAGTWPAFWLLPADPWGTYGGRPPIHELDVMEILGASSTKMYCSVHWTDLNGAQQHGPADAPVAGGTSWYRRYGLLWSPQAIEWYLDDQLMRKTVNPGIHLPMYMLANLAIGGWDGAVPPSSAKPTMAIDYIRAWSLARPA